MTMINFLLTILSLLTPLIFGAIFLLLLSKYSRFYWLEFLAISFGLGSVFLTILLFVLSLFGLSLSTIKSIILISALISLIFIILFRKRFNLDKNKLSLNAPAQSWVKVLIILLILIIVFKIFFVCTESLLRPILQYDAMATWSLKAKNFFLHNKLNLNPNQPHFVGSPYFDYFPEEAFANYLLHLPLLQTWTALSLNNWSETAIKILFLLYYFSLLIIFYFSLRRYLSLIKTLIFTFFLTSLPFLVYHAIHDYLDLPLAFYLLTAMVYCWRGIKENNFVFFTIGSLSAAAAAWTKLEGLPLGLIILISATVDRLISKQFKPKFFIFYFLFFIFQLPWLIFKFFHHLGFENVPGLTFKPSVLKIFFLKFISTINWNIWWLIFVIVLIFNWRKIFARNFRFMSLIVFLSIGCYLAIYVFTANFQFIVGSVVDQRNLLTIIPMTIFYIALFFSDKFDKIET